LPLQRLKDEKQVLLDSLSDPWEILDQSGLDLIESGEELFFARPGVPTERRSMHRRCRKDGS
jgi:hypothetical protein